MVKTIIMRSVLCHAAERTNDKYIPNSINWVLMVDFGSPKERKELSFTRTGRQTKKCRLPAAAAVAPHT